MNTKLRDQYTFYIFKYNSIYKLLTNQSHCLLNYDFVDNKRFREVVLKKSFLTEILFKYIRNIVVQRAQKDSFSSPVYMTGSNVYMTGSPVYMTG